MPNVKARLLLVAAAIFSLPLAALAMPPADARHLLARTGFGGTATEIERLAAADYAQAVARILAGVRTQPQTQVPDWINDPPPDLRRYKRLSEEQRRAFRKERRAQGIQLKAWWYQEMINTDSALTERMTLFWHNHFTSGLRKVKWPALMYRQNLLLRRHALGNFREMLHAIAKDPAMILYLDNQSNRKGKPNENFAREVMELFTLGEGNYSERDIKEAARAFTGWMVDRTTGQFRANPRWHDPGDKTFMGQTGAFDGDDILDIILEQPQVAIFISEKLWREFVSGEPDPREIARLARIFRTADYEIKPLVQAILMSPAFRAAGNRGTLIKSPVELIVGTARMFDIGASDGRRFARLGRYLGQDLFDPPNVKGWPGGNAWITSNTLLARQHFLELVVRATRMPPGDGPRAPAMVSRALPTAGKHRIDAGLRADNAGSVLLPIAPVNAIAASVDLDTLIGRLVLDPAYQLK